MTLPTLAHLPSGPSTAPPRFLAHDVQPLHMRQQRLVNRVALTPSVNLEKFKFRAVIDWIEVELHFVRRTQAHHVQTVLRQFVSRDSHVIPKDLGPGAVFTKCRIKVQEPKNFALVATICAALRGSFGEAAGARVTGLEISVDAYSRPNSSEARAQLLGVMQRTIWTDRDIWSNAKSRPRSIFYDTKIRVLYLSCGHEMDDTLLCRTDENNHTIPRIDGTMYLGAKDDAVMIRLMDKIKDAQRPDGTYDDLPDDQRRVRIEVTLKEAELVRLGVTDIASLRAFKLTKIQGNYFQFRLPTFSIIQFPDTNLDRVRNSREIGRANTYMRSGVSGLMNMDAGIRVRRQRMVRQEIATFQRIGKKPTRPERLAPAFVSYDALNRKVALALRDLEKRERTAWAKKDSELLPNSWTVFRLT